MPVRLMSAAACALVTVVLVGLLRWDPALAARLVSEDGPVEWTQAALLVAALVMAVACGLALARLERPVAADVLLAAMMAGLVIGEMDLDKRLFGMKLISTKFFVNPSIPLGYRALGFLLVVGPPVALAVYAWRWRAELWAAAVRALREPWGQVLVAGGVVLGFTEIFERQLGYMPGYPRNFLEEGLEVCAAVCFFLGLVARRHAIMKGLKPMIIGVLALACAFLAGCRGEGPASASQDKGKPPAAAPRPVRVAPAAQEMVARSVVVNGTLAADDLVVLGTKVAGRLTTIAVDLGTHVRRGQVIAQLDKSDFALRIEQAEAALQQHLDDLVGELGQLTQGPVAGERHREHRRGVVVELRHHGRPRVARQVAQGRRHLVAHVLRGHVDVAVEVEGHDDDGRPGSRDRAQLLDPRHRVDGFLQLLGQLRLHLFRGCPGQLGADGDGGQVDGGEAVDAEARVAHRAHHAQREDDHRREHGPPDTDFGELLHG